MDFERVRTFVDTTWQDEAMPALINYVAIPAESPAFDAGWRDHGHMERAVALLAGWAERQLADIADARVEVIEPEGRTPSIFVTIPGDGGGALLIYGHHDKQPAMEGWAAGRGAWSPAIEGDRLYGRGGADDGYALFSAILAVRALREQGLSHPAIQILIEGSEESGSPDLAATFDALGGRLAAPRLLIALDAGCGDYARLWTTTSVRGQVAGTLTVRTLREGVHSGDVSGVIASPFRIARHLLSRLEDPKTGKVADPAFNAPIPAERRDQARAAGEILGDAVFASLPAAGATRAAIESAAEQLLARTWRPQLAITGLDGLPPVADAAAVMQPMVALKLSLRLPPTVDPEAAAARMKALLEADPPYSCEVAFTPDMLSPGWNASATAPGLAETVERASLHAFGASAASFGGGGGIPFLAMLGERFPGVQFLVTGVLGPQSNAHGPNEFLHLPTARRLTAALAHIIHSEA